MAFEDLRQPGMSGDIYYDPKLKRCINVDIRYVLFVIDKLGGAGHLVKEMKLVSSDGLGMGDVGNREIRE